MDSVNVFRGYGKVSQVEAQSPNQNPTRKKPLVIIITTAVAVLLTLAIGSAVAMLAHQSSQEERAISENPIKRVCRVTPHPDSCFAAVSPLKTKPDPESILKLSLQVSVKDLSRAASSIRELNDARSESALRDCVDQFDDALSRLNDSVAAMEVVSPGEKMLDEVKVKNIQTWISAAMTDQETCLDGLEEIGSAVVDQVKARLLSSKQSISNSLAIVAKMKDLLQDFDLNLH